MKQKIKDDILSLYEKYGDIKIKCEAKDTLPIDLILDFQGALKKRHEKKTLHLIELIFRKGFIAPFFIWNNKGDNFCLDGHGRIEAVCLIREAGVPIPGAFPVAYIEADNEADAREMLLSITSQIGEFDKEELQEWIDQVDSDIAELLHFTEKDIDLSISGGSEETEGDDEISEDVQPITKLGDIWELGAHRLLCGDSTEIENIMELLDGNKIDFVFTDPPYGISIVRNDKPFGKGKNGFDSVVKCGEYEPIKGDETIDSAIAAYDISKALKVNIILLWGGNFYAHKLPPAKCWVVWDKETAGKFGDGEIAWCSAKKSIRIFRHKWSGRIKASEHREKRQHPTQKPVALAEWAINEFMNSDQNNILDFFAGAGFTILAAEKLNKRSFLCELSEHYCDVIVKRYIDWMTKNNREINIKLNGKPFDYSDMLPHE